MKPLSLSAALRLAVTFALPALPLLAHGQNVIQRSSEPYHAKPAIQFVIPKPATAQLLQDAAPESAVRVASVAVDPSPHHTSGLRIGETVLSQASDAAVTAQGLPGQQRMMPALVWSVVPADGTISATLNRWASQAGYKIFWQAQKDLPSVGTTYRGTFEGALEALMVDTKHSSYALHACLYDNKVVRVLHAVQSCQQE